MEPLALRRPYPSPERRGGSSPAAGPGTVRLWTKRRARPGQGDPLHSCALSPEWGHLGSGASLLLLRGPAARLKGAEASLSSLQADKTQEGVSNPSCGAELDFQGGLCSRQPPTVPPTPRGLQGVQLRKGRGRVGRTRPRIRLNMAGLWSRVQEVLQPTPAPSSLRQWPVGGEGRANPLGDPPPEGKPTEGALPSIP